MVNFEIILIALVSCAVKGFGEMELDNEKKKWKFVRLILG